MVLWLTLRPAPLPTGARLLTPAWPPSTVFTLLISKSAFSTQPYKAANILGSLHNFKDSYGKVIRRGRGPSSGKGKTSGRGHKGQGQHGGVPDGMNGGQTPDHVVAGSYGFKNSFSKPLTPLNVGRLQAWIDSKRIDPTKPITLKELVESRCVHGIKNGLKLLGDGAATFKAPVNITVSCASSSAITAIEAAGGSITTRYFNRQAILQTVYPHYYPDNPRMADPVSRKRLEYYRNPDNRGYLASTLKPGDNPHSLFFRSPEEADKLRNRKRRAKGKKKQVTDRLW